MRKIQVWTVTKEGKDEYFDRFEVAMDYLRGMAKSLAAKSVAAKQDFPPISLSYRFMTNVEYQRLTGDGEE